MSGSLFFGRATVKTAKLSRAVRFGCCGPLPLFMHSMRVLALCRVGLAHPRLRAERQCDRLRHALRVRHFVDRPACLGAHSGPLGVLTNASLAYKRKRSMCLSLQLLRAALTQFPFLDITRPPPIGKLVVRSAERLILQRAAAE